MRKHKFEVPTNNYFLGCLHKNNVSNPVTYNQIILVSYFSLIFKTASVWLQEPFLSYNNQIQYWKLPTVSYFCGMNNNSDACGIV